MSAAPGCSDRPHIIKILAGDFDGSLPPVEREAGFGVIEGLERPTRGCWWKLVAVYKTEEGAKRRLAKLPVGHGRGIVDFSYPRLRLIAPDGTILRDREQLAKLLG